MHQQVLRPRQDPTEDPSEPICEDTDFELTSRVEGSKSRRGGDDAEMECTEPLLQPSVREEFSHSTETADVDVAEGSESKAEVEHDNGAVTGGHTSDEEEDDEEDSHQPLECRKAIRKMGLQKGSLRAMITSNLLPKADGLHNPVKILPDSNETCKSPEEEIMVMCTPAMIDLLKAGQADANAVKKFERQGAPLSQILKTLKSGESDLAGKLSKELANTKIQARRRKVRNTTEDENVDSMTLRHIRKSYAERQYQRMLEKDVGGCVNALKARTEDKWCDQRLLELKLSFSTGLSAIIVFVASFLVGYYFAVYCLGIKSLSTKILLGSITAVFGGLLEAILLTIAYGRIEAKVK